MEMPIARIFTCILGLVVICMNGTDFLLVYRTYQTFFFIVTLIALIISVVLLILILVNVWGANRATGVLDGIFHIIFGILLLIAAVFVSVDLASYRNFNAMTDGDKAGYIILDILEFFNGLLYLMIGWPICAC